MKPGIKQSNKQIKRWRGETAWWLLLIEGGVSAGFGICILLRPAAAQGWVLLFLAIVLALHGLLTLADFLLGRRQGNFPLVRGSIGLIIGVVIILMPLFGFGDRLMAAWLLAIGLLATGGLALVAPFIETAGGARRGGFLLAIFLLILGAIVLYNVVSGVAVLQPVAWTLVLFGAVLIGYGVFTRSKTAAAGA